MRAQGVQSAIKRIRNFIKAGVLAESSFVGRRVLDWECGSGDFGIAFLILGAKDIVGSDTWLDLNSVSKAFGEVDDAKFLKGRLPDLLAQESVAPCEFDLIFANTVTEHLQDLALQLLALNAAVKFGGEILLNHQNYYGPSGHHDFAFVDDIGGGMVGQKSISCWQTSEKCLTSVEFRRDLARSRPWIWNKNSDQKLTPEDCTKCIYKKRSQPWAHLLYSDNFVETFPLPGFMTGKPKASLNKITMFQLHQFVIEAGFEINKTNKTHVKNDPPKELLAAPHYFSHDELCTWMFRISATKTRDMSDIYPQSSSVVRS